MFEEMWIESDKQEVAQERHPHRLALEVVDDMLAHVTGADAIIDRIVKPARLLQQVGKRCLAHAGHAEDGHGLLGPVAELLARREMHGGSLCRRRGLPATGGLSWLNEERFRPVPRHLVRSHCQPGPAQAWPVRHGGGRGLRHWWWPCGPDHGAGAGPARALGRASRKPPARLGPPRDGTAALSPTVLPRGWTRWRDG